MKMVIAAEYDDVTNIKELFSNLVMIKGNFPKIKSCHDLVNKRKYSVNKKKKYGGINPDYPKNVINDIKDNLNKNDFVIIPIDSKLLSELYKNNKIKNIFIYEKNKDDFNPDPDPEHEKINYWLYNGLDETIDEM